MKLYHSTLNAKKISEGGFHKRAHRYPDHKKGVWFTDQLLGLSDGIRKYMRALVIDMPTNDIVSMRKEMLAVGTELLLFLMILLISVK